jgi:WD40 repeat protein
VGTCSCHCQPNASPSCSLLDAPRTALSPTMTVNHVTTLSLATWTPYSMSAILCDGDHARVSIMCRVGFPALRGSRRITRRLVQRCTDHGDCQTGPSELWNRFDLRYTPWLKACKLISSTTRQCWEQPLKDHPDVAPLREPLSGHIDKVLDIASSPDGNQVASYSKDGTIRLWDAQMGPIGELFSDRAGHCFLPRWDLARLILLRPHCVTLWDVQTGVSIGTTAQRCKGNTEANERQA